MGDTDDNLPAFWEWKRAELWNNLVAGKILWSEFETMWAAIRENSTEAPDRTNGTLTDFYFWKSKRPRTLERGMTPSEEHMRAYYFDHVYPKVRNVLMQRMVDQKRWDRQRSSEERSTSAR
jgi:hypothetical protein